MEFKELNLKRFQKDRKMEILFSEKGSFSDGRPYVRMRWKSSGCTMHSFLFTAQGFDYEKDWKEDALSHGIPQELLGYPTGEGVDPILLREDSANIRCFGEPDERLIAVNIMVEYDSI